MDKVIELLKSKYQEACGEIKIAEKVLSDFNCELDISELNEKVSKELVIYKEYRDSLWQAMIVLKYLKK